MVLSSYMVAREMAVISNRKVSIEDLRFYTRLLCQTQKKQTPLYRKQQVSTVSVVLGPSEIRRCSETWMTADVKDTNSPIAGLGDHVRQTL